MDIIRTRLTNWIGHILRATLLQREIIEGMMEVKRGRGRPRQKLMDWVMKDRYKKLKENAQHGEERRVTGKNGIGQKGTDKIVRTEWYKHPYINGISLIPLPLTL